MSTAARNAFRSAVLSVENLPIILSDLSGVSLPDSSRIHVIVHQDLPAAMSTIERLSKTKELYVWALNPFVQTVLSESWKIRVGLLQACPSGYVAGSFPAIGPDDLRNFVSKLWEKRQAKFRGLQFLIPEVGEIESLEQILDPGLFVIDPIGVYCHRFSPIHRIQIPRWFGKNPPMGFNEGVCDLISQIFEHEAGSYKGISWRVRSEPVATRKRLPPLFESGKKFEEFLLSKSGILAIFSRGLGPGTWQSLRSVIAAQNAGWTAFQKMTPLKCFFLPEDERVGFLEPNLRALCREGVFSYLSPRAFRICKDYFPNMKSRVFHLHGEASHGLVGLGENLQKFTENDIFFASCWAEAKALKQSLPRARAAAIAPPVSFTNHLVQRQRLARDKHFLYLGRLNPLKNIHGLICAYAKLKSNWTSGDIPYLEIVGPWDSDGIDRVGLPKVDYKKFIQELIGEMELSSFVKIRPAVSEKRVAQLLADPSVILVNTSFSPDEDFGLVAAQALSLGRTAVLSNWGGHIDLCKRFRRQVFTALVYQGKFGPYLDLNDFSRKLASALLAHPIADTDRVHRRPRQFATEVCRALSGNADRKVSKALSQSRGSRILLSRALTGAKVFGGFADPLARPLRMAYGSDSRTFKLKKENKLIFSCVEVGDRNVFVQSPVLGEIKFKKRPL
ncbi:MAG: glycosyltransferase [Bdellovibrionales bacterium]|nr:glycosyltransferase [Bdellovibrionales bacterium]